MSTSNSLLGFFTLMSNQGGTIVREQAKLDLDLYIQNYSGRTRFDRLLHIAKSSVPLCVDALKAAIAEAKSGIDVTQYNDAWDCIRFAAPGEPEAQKDQAWVDKTDRANRAETARLETELKQYRHNLIKESIRMGNEELGTHFEKIGSLVEAAEAYNRMRQDVTTTKHIIDCGLHLVNVYLYRRDWSMVINSLGKITGVQTGEEEKFYQPFTKLVSGIALLGLKHYSDAAKNFLQIDFDIPPTQYNHIASPNDIATYGGLLALATMERKELQARVLDNSSFRSFLEHEPHVRKAISLFVNGRYSACLTILESFRNDYMLDIYLQRHVPAIYAQIRNKCITQYFVPFSCATMDNLNEAFAPEGESIENELVSMIRDGTLRARLDAKNKLLIAVQPDPRLQMQKNAIEVARQYELEAKERLRRISIISAGLEVVGKRQPPLIGRGVEETWFDEPKPSEPTSAAAEA
ncbi:hypothetical protein CEP52_010909 [Fusarium oligoseptatum]|uniref:PCI domain-containing protein n=1 Tax=Fusarium oligoseptatum TaxID=2604345 RepID=A0A428T5Y9_9HYPO|nr:hypothetical protein CEP52_010909 [Fusarium oligoseptatum]